ncbi:tyrosine-type recombinase/integrase [Magnetospirillum aberrantis]|uniref:Tyrosine-type recombinase/integrase n=1 Tax=Magnetospirillum aberrantis SpK TaxID=908842 RepID=A0A7C9QV09_9PROT|nr:site-specific integrase [Magnetospirillum aberrantis]NFV81300.1 tyrosine-type recombinase/integrase [Magnetospirillum aberrantis SpK]
MKRQLTDRTIQSIKPPMSGVVEVTDAAVTGLQIRVTANGVRSWALRYRIDGKHRRMALGEYRPEAPDHISLEAARRVALDALALAKNGTDPAAAATTTEATTASTTVRVAAERFIRAQRRKGLRSVGEQERLLDLHVLPEIGDMPIGAVERRHVYVLLEKLRDGGFGAQVNRVLTQTKTFLNWAVEAGEIAANPAAVIKRMVPEKPRERVLSGDEVAKVILAADGVGYPVAPLVRLLLLTGQRREEVTQARWSEFDLENGYWTIPAERTKAKREHRLPLPKAVVDMLNQLPRFTSDGTEDRGYVFSARGGRKPYAGWRRAAQNLQTKAALSAPWTIHDLRRTAASMMGEAGADEAIISRVLNHSPRSRMGITATYERSRRDEAMRSALESVAYSLEKFIEEEKRKNPE